MTHPLADLERALDRFERAVWVDAAACAERTGGGTAFRQGLTMLPSGRARLEEIRLAPALCTQSALRRRGIRVPDYLFEGLGPGERLFFVRQRIRPASGEIAPYAGSRPGGKDGSPVRATQRAGLPARMLRLAAEWRRARAEVRAFRGEREQVPTRPA